VEARIERDGEGLVARYRLPEGCTATVVEPPGMRCIPSPIAADGSIELRFEAAAAAV
jgi:hypothetical protein